MTTPPSLRANLRGLPRSAWMLFAGAFINRFGTFVAPFLTVWLTHSAHSPAAAGFAISAYGAGHVAASALGGLLSDRIGPRLTIAGSMFVSAAAALGLSQLHAYGAILAAIVLLGAAAETYRPAAAALIGDVVERERRTTAYAMLRWANNLGFAAGPATAGLLAGRSFGLLFFADAATSVAFGLIAISWLPRGQRARATDAEDGGALRDIGANTPFLMFLLGGLCITWIEYQVVTTLPLHVAQLGYSPAVYGQLISLNGLLVVTLELLLTKWTQRLRPRHVIAAGFALFAGGFALVGTAHAIPMLALAVVVWTFGEMISMPVAGAYVTALAPERYRGRYQGLWHLTWSIGMLLGPALGALAFGSHPLAYWCAVAVAGVVGAAFVLVPLQARPQGDAAPCRRARRPLA